MSEPKGGHVYKQAKTPLTSTETSRPHAPPASEKPPSTPQAKKENPTKAPEEIGGPEGPEPTRYGDWERNGRCVDF
jgi:hypothetical protein